MGMNSQEIDKEEFYIIYHRDVNEDIDYLLGKSPSFIVVGGVSNGHSISQYLRRYPKAFISGFEANPDLKTDLSGKFRKYDRVDIYFDAIGNQNENISFNVFEHVPSSSILNSSKDGKEYYGSRYNITKKVAIRQVRLDSVLLDKDIDILKLDLQGYEMEALKGCSGILDSIKVITLEVAFIKAYENQPLFGDIDLFLRDNNFRLFNFSSLWHARGGKIIAGDALYLNNAYFEGV